MNAVATPAELHRDALSLAAMARESAATGIERLAVTGTGPRLRSVAVLLTGPWLGAELTLSDGATPRLRITSSTQTIELEPFGL